jgi:hypothetical protein
MTISHSSVEWCSKRVRNITKEITELEYRIGTRSRKLPDDKRVLKNKLNLLKHWQARLDEAKSKEVSNA